LEVLERARRGESVDSSDVSGLFTAWSTGALSDAQMAAWCAATGLRGMPDPASHAVVRALLAGGDRLELARLGNSVDIRSTGGVGDSALVIAASCIASAAGVIVASTGARSIAHVGGVLDAVAAIPGMADEMPVERWVLQARDMRMVIAEAGDRLVPDERRLASLRDSTATAEGDALVAVTTAARGISGGANAIAVSVAGGSGGLLPDMEHAQAAAALIGEVGATWNRRVACVPVMRDVPVAGVAGHALEVRAALGVLAGSGDAALADAACALAHAALGAAGEEIALPGVRAILDDGRAAAAAERWIAGQGGDAAVLSDVGRLPQSRLRPVLEAVDAGMVQPMDCALIGRAARWLGAGRLDPGQVIDPSVGVEVLVRPGASVAAGDVLAVVHASDDWLARRALEMLGSAITVAA
jgi:thymidine phosphorylase